MPRPARRPQTRTSRWGRASLLALLVIAVPACASLPKVRTAQPSHALADTGGTTLGHMAAGQMSGRASPSGIHLLPQGPVAFYARLALAEMAERSIDAQYYIWQRDRVGKLLLGALVRAADRGVRVRLLVDDIGSLPDDDTLRMIDAHENIEVRLFNPASSRVARSLWVFTEFSRVNRRMHNKSFTVDNQVTVVGGRNIGDEYFQAGSVFNYGDVDAVAIGAVVPEVSARFDRYWNAEVVYGIRELHPEPMEAGEAEKRRTRLLDFAEEQRHTQQAAAARDSDWARELRERRVSFADATIRVTSDDPAKVERPPDNHASTNLLPQLAPEFNGVHDRLVLVSPYFVPGKGGVRWLSDLRARGVRVALLTNGLGSTDVLPVFSKYRKYRRPLIEAGVEIYEVNPRSGALKPAVPAEDPDAPPPGVSLHGKLLAFDCRQFFVGSMNLDPRSARLNTEIGFVVDAPDVARTLCEGLDRSFANGAYRVEVGRLPGGGTRLEWVGKDGGRDVRLTGEPHSSRWQRVKAWFFGILPIEGQM